METINKIKRDRRTEKWMLYSIIIIWVFFALFAALFDLEISILVVNQNSSWARFLADYGEIPGYIIIIAALFIYNRSRLNADNGFNILLSILIFLILIWEVYLVGERILSKYISFKDNLILIVPIISLCIFYVQKLLGRMEINQLRNYDIFSQITLTLAILNPFLFVQGAKILWGRVRFRDLMPDYSNYTPWFLPQGINGNYSFPSGHSAMGWMLLPIMILTFKNGRKTQFLFILLIFIWGIFVSLSRIVIGAHYFSDVLFSTGMAMIVYLLLYKRYYDQIY